MDSERGTNELAGADAARHLRAALEALGVDLDQPDLRETPQRVAELWRELFAGLDVGAAPTFTALSNADPSAGMVLARGLRFYSLCAHHLLPFFGRAHLAYLPGRRLAGLGDLARVLDYFCRRPTLQEHVAAAVADHLESGLESRGVAVLLEGRHLCMEMRGQRKRAVVESSAYRGVYVEPAARAEFLDRLRRD